MAFGVLVDGGTVNVKGVSINEASGAISSFGNITINNGVVVAEA